MVIQYSNVDTVKPFREVVINDRLARIQQDFLHGMRCVKSSFYILDHLVFHYLVTDMLFFASINLITPEELKELQEELSCCWRSWSVSRRKDCMRIRGTKCIFICRILILTLATVTMGSRIIN